MRASVILAISATLLATPASVVLAAEPAQAASLAAPKFTTSDTDIGSLLDNPETKAILVKHIPEVVNSDQIEMARTLTLRSIQQFAAEQLTDEKLAVIDADLAKVK
jgi:para-nitrobenzyl esterase